MVASAIAHVTGLTDVTPDNWLVSAAQLVTGTAIGARFSEFERKRAGPRDFDLADHLDRADPSHLRLCLSRRSHRRPALSGSAARLLAGWPRRDGLDRHDLRRRSRLRLDEPGLPLLHRRHPLPCCSSASARIRGRRLNLELSLKSIEACYVAIRDHASCRRSVPHPHRLSVARRRAAGSATRITATPSFTRTAPASPRAASSICCSSATPANTSENHGGNHHAAVEYGMRWPKHDMMPLVPLMARAAPGVGFGLTMSTTYQHPFHVARLFNSLDHITGGASPGTR